MNVSPANQFNLAHSFSQASDFQNLAGLQLASANLDESDSAELEQVAKKFESLFMHMMLKSMRKANRSFSEGNYFDSFESKMYEDMLDEKLSTHLTQSHSIGIAESFTLE
ncbi:MAG: hypothetical protein COA99_00020 [Moraxellaceae bacterium]|nr:MAG: hypothetical protein COA99_00020 [Moraxellaceae bacterium]